MKKKHMSTYVDCATEVCYRSRCKKTNFPIFKVNYNNMFICIYTNKSRAYIHRENAYKLILVVRIISLLNLGKIV